MNESIENQLRKFIFDIAKTNIRTLDALIDEIVDKPTNETRLVFTNIFVMAVIQARIEYTGKDNNELD